MRIITNSICFRYTNGTPALCRLLLNAKIRRQNRIKTLTAQRLNVSAPDGQCKTVLNCITILFYFSRINHEYALCLPVDSDAADGVFAAAHAHRPPCRYGRPDSDRVAAATAAKRRAAVFQPACTVCRANGLFGQSERAGVYPLPTPNQRFGYAVFAGFLFARGLPRQHYPDYEPPRHQPPVV